MDDYVLITAARNEQALIEGTIKSVVSQTFRPAHWAIVSDGSTDLTEEIVRRYSCSYEWIRLIRMPEHRDRSFAAKAHCFNRAYQELKKLDFGIIGNLDADITFDPDYFRFLIEKFQNDPRLGVAGTPFIEGISHYDYRFASIDHVSGACQLFRRTCFEEIGGYIPIKEGGIDWIAVTTARMRGWKTRTFLEKVCIHHRKVGTGDSRAWAAIFIYGKKNYMLRSHPAWHISRALLQMKDRPYVIGGLLSILGYLYGFLNRTKSPLSEELISFYRKEQMVRLKTIVLRPFRKARESS